MEFLADENVEAPIVAMLRDAGHDVLYISDIGGSPSDDHIIDLACQTGRILVTNDKGFGEQVFRDQRTLPGAILLRFGEEDAVVKRQVLARVVQQFGEHFAGKFTVVPERQIRMRALP